MAIFRLLTDGFGLKGAPPDVLLGGLVSNEWQPALLPNPRRTLQPVAPDYAGRDFLPMAPGETDVFTFDCRRFLGCVPFNLAISMTVAAADPASALIDPAAASRLIAGPVLDVYAIQISGRLADLVDGARYRLTARAQDEGGNTVTTWSYLECRAPGDCPPC